MAASPHKLSLPATSAGQALGPLDTASVRNALSFLAGLKMPLVEKEILDEIVRDSPPRPTKRAHLSTSGRRAQIQSTSDLQVASNGTRKCLLIDLPREILRITSQFLDNADYLKLLYTCRALRAFLVYDYFVRLGLVSTTTTTVVKLQGDIPFGAFSLMHSLPAFKTSRWQLNCHVYYLVHLPLSIGKLLHNQPHLVNLCLEYALEESGLLHDSHLPYALSHLLGRIQPNSCRLEISCIPGCKLGRDPRKATPASLGRLRAAAKRASIPSTWGFERVTLPFSWLKTPPLVPFCLHLFASRTIEQLTVNGITSQGDLNLLLSHASFQPKVTTLSLYAKPTSYLSVPSLSRQFPLLEQFGYHDQVAHPRDDAQPHIRLPALIYLLLTPTFSSVSMVDTSKLRFIYLTPSRYCLDPASSEFCLEVAKIYQFLAVLGKLDLFNVEIALWMPSDLSEHLSKAPTCSCLDPLPHLKAFPVKGISKLVFQSSECCDSVHKHFLSLLPFFPNVDEMALNPSDDHQGSKFSALLSSSGLESTAVKRLTHGKDSYIKAPSGVWINE